MKGRIRQPRSRNDLFDGREEAARQGRSEGPLRRGPEDEPGPRRIRQMRNRNWSVRGAASAHGMGRRPSLEPAYSRYATSCRKPPRCVSMPGGVGGGARESSSYPILLPAPRTQYESLESRGPAPQRKKIYVRLRIAKAVRRAQDWRPWLRYAFRADRYGSSFVVDPRCAGNRGRRFSQSDWLVCRAWF